MPPYQWATDPIDLIGPFETRHAQANVGGLFAWAAWSVDSLHYLADLDQHQYDISNSVIDGYQPHTVDVAHVRWATSTCITSFDLCAAGLARAFCGHRPAKEVALKDFDPTTNGKRVSDYRALLPCPARQWIDDVLADRRYKDIKVARDSLTHSRVSRHFTLVAGGPPQRLRLEIDNRTLEVREIVELARDLATQYVSRLLMMLPQFP